MRLFHSEVYDAFREIGVSHEKALAAAAALYATPPPRRVDVPAWSNPWSSGSLLGVMMALLAGCLFFAGYVVCQHGLVEKQAAKTRAVMERLVPSHSP